MAKYNVICEKCEKEYNICLFGKHKDRYRILGIEDESELPVKYGICEKCEEEKKQKWVEENNRKNENNTNLPQLEGTEKQIAWAISIRDKKIKEINHLLSLFRERIENKKKRMVKLGHDEKYIKDFFDRWELPKIVQNLIEWKEKFQTEKWSSWIIENRYIDMQRCHPNEV